MTLLQLIGFGGAVIFVLVTLLWILSLILKDAGIADVFWGTGFVLSFWIFFLLGPDGCVPRKALLGVLVTVWGLRLSLHILRRNWGRGEDFRYRKWRLEAGRSWWWRSWLKVFLLQGSLLWIISLPLAAAQDCAGHPRLTMLDLLAIAVWCLGFFFETAGDWQLARFKSDPQNRGKVLRTGVWRYTRHPNYFGDAVQWWAFYMIAAASGAYWSVFSPLLMTYLLMRVSGVALLEKTLIEAKSGYSDYVQSTNAFVPWFPREAG
jgi:steroid 5-alpha reductase family enzyme